MENNKMKSRKYAPRSEDGYGDCDEDMRGVKLINNSSLWLINVSQYCEWLHSRAVFSGLTTSAPSTVLTASPGHLVSQTLSLSWTGNWGDILREHRSHIILVDFELQIISIKYWLIIISKQKFSEYFLPSDATPGSVLLLTMNFISIRSRNMKWSVVLGRKISALTNLEQVLFTRQCPCVSPACWLTPWTGCEPRYRESPGWTTPSSPPPRPQPSPAQTACLAATTLTPSRTARSSTSVCRTPRCRWSARMGQFFHR